MLEGESGDGGACDGRSSRLIEAITRLDTQTPRYVWPNGRLHPLGATPGEKPAVLICTRFESGYFTAEALPGARMSRMQLTLGQLDGDGDLAVIDVHVIDHEDLTARININIIDEDEWDSSLIDSLLAHFEDWAEGGSNSAPVAELHVVVECERVRIALAQNGYTPADKPRFVTQWMERTGSALRFGLAADLELDHPSEVPDELVIAAGESFADFINNYVSDPDDDWMDVVVEFDAESENIRPTAGASLADLEKLEAISPEVLLSLEVDTNGLDAPAEVLPCGFPNRGPEHAHGWFGGYLVAMTRWIGNKKIGSGIDLTDDPLWFDPADWQ